MNKRILINLAKGASMPLKATEGSVGYDLVATSSKEIILPNNGGTIISYGTGISLAMPLKTYCRIYARSSVYKTGLTLCNSVGIIDTDYTGELKVNFYKVVHGEIYKIGDRIAQLVFDTITDIEWHIVDELPETERGEGGFGSTGN